MPRPAGSIVEYLLSQIDEHPQDIVALAAARYRISPVAVQKHLRKLVAQGRVRKEGNTSGTRWYIASHPSWHGKVRLTPETREDEVWKSLILPCVPDGVPTNVGRILQFGFTEMFNNVIDHA